jgi:hypothetical protein
LLELEENFDGVGLQVLPRVDDFMVYAAQQYEVVESMSFFIGLAGVIARALGILRPNVANLAHDSS